jgi:branched-chain amino acid transport system substrate-binding protein
MATFNDKPAEKDDIFKILSAVPPAEVEDKAALTACKLESYGDTKVIEP